MMTPAKHGLSGIGRILKKEDGTSGGILTIVIEEELGYGLMDNQMETVEDDSINLYLFNHY